MGEKHGTSRLMDNQQEIADILQVAISHNWNFSYSVADMVPGVSFNTELLGVDPDFESVTIGSEVKYIGLKDYEEIHFRSQSGGLSIKFDSHLLPSSGGRLTNKLLGECRIAYPKHVQYTQLRQAVRVNFARLQEIPVTVFLNDGSHVTGIVDDMSVTGLRAKFPGPKVKNIDTDQPITDCILLLPDKSSVGARVQILGALHDMQKETSFLRFRFLQFNDDAELKLEELINSSLERLKVLRTSTA